MTQFLQQLINGLSLGSIYALIALGYTMVYGIIKLINFAHGDIYMLGAYIGFICTAQLGMSFFPALVAAMAVCALIGVVIERIAYKPLRNATRITALITAIGVSYFLEASTQKVMGTGVKTFPQVLANQKIMIGDVMITTQQIAIFATTIGLMLLLQFIVRKTKVGRAMPGGVGGRGRGAADGRQRRHDDFLYVCDRFGISRGGRRAGRSVL